jgi:hypothetical protein
VLIIHDYPSLMLISAGLKIFHQIFDTAVQVAKESVKGDEFSISVVVRTVGIQAVVLKLFSWKEVRQ